MKGEYEPARPWSYIWWLATCPESPSTAEWAWWDANFDKQAQMIINGVAADTRFLGGDAQVAHRFQDHFAAAHNAKAINDQAIGGGGGGARGAPGGGKAIADDWGSGGKGAGKPGGKAKEGKGGKGKAKGDAPVVYMQNSKNKKLCDGFQNGSCKSKWLPKESKYDPVCPQHKDQRHQCNACLGYDHGGARCTANAQSGAPWKKRKRK